MTASPCADRLVARLRIAWPDKQVTYDGGVLTVTPFEPLPVLHVHLPLEQVDAMCEPSAPTLELLWPDSSREVAGVLWFATQVLDVLRHPSNGDGPSHVVCHQGRLLAVHDPDDPDERAQALEPRAPITRGLQAGGRRLEVYAPNSGTWYRPRPVGADGDPGGE